MLNSISQFGGLGARIATAAHQGCATILLFKQFPARKGNGRAADNAAADKFYASQNTGVLV
jgi:hypothetical protein